MVPIPATIQRGKGGDTGTFGNLSILGWNCFTGECPWRNNQTGLSCVPGAGRQYLMKWTITDEHPKGVYVLQDVEDREDCEMHTGDWCGDVTKGYKSDVKGCIIIGRTYGILEGQPAVMESREAYADLVALTNKQDILLTILDAA